MAAAATTTPSTAEQRQRCPVLAVRRPPLAFTDDDEIEAALAWFREHGFPYPDLPPHERIAEFRRLQAKDCQIDAPGSVLFDELRCRHLTVDGTGANVANAFHRHIWESSAEGRISAVEGFGRDKCLRRAIMLAKQTTGSITPARVLNKLRIVTPVQVCSNFRPLAAKTIYDAYGDAATRVVLDMSAGYGGRLLGFLASKLAGHAVYVGVDPSHRTVEGNRAMAEFFGARDRVAMHEAAFEDFDLAGAVGPVDMMLTSPPYFRKERYDGDDPRQSSNRYGEYDSWLDGFWFPSLAKVVECLRGPGPIVVNIADIKLGKTRYPLVDDTIEHVTTRLGLVLSERLELRMSGFGKHLAKCKTEPVLVFRRQGVEPPRQGA